ncbi:MAG: hypothetical protein NXI20_00570 [bacterium]|nr:hypothetical protein [bacterium]
MKPETEYIQFNISDTQKFLDCVRVFQLLKECRESETEKEYEYWISQFPEYSLQEYIYSDKTLQPFEKIKNQEHGWEFEAIIDYMVFDLEIDLICLEQLTDDTGILKFQAQAYPYGGLSVIIEYLRTFGCMSSKAFDGAYITNIYWIDEYQCKFEDVGPTGERLNKKSSLFSRIISWLKRKSS